MKSNVKIKLRIKITNGRKMKFNQERRNKFFTQSHDNH